MSVVATPDCTPKCRSAQHADEVVAAMTCGSEEGRLCTYLTAHCHNAATLRDGFGRTALHLAASLGKRALLEWLLDSKSADLLAKDKESSWTALHRSAFYGHIHCLMALVKVSPRNQSRNVAEGACLLQTVFLLWTHNHSYEILLSEHS